MGYLFHKVAYFRCDIHSEMFQTKSVIHILFLPCWFVFITTVLPQGLYPSYVVMGLNEGWKGGGATWPTHACLSLSAKYFENPILFPYYHSSQKSSHLFAL